MAGLKQYEDLAALVARLFMGALFVLYGYFKLTGYAGTVAYMGRRPSGPYAICGARGSSSNSVVVC
jgi:uncharacterized membrane protein YphA (DoxX/SURF4 family)